jgi:hypothetical protein
MKLLFLAIILISCSINPLTPEQEKQVTDICSSLDEKLGTHFKKIIKLGPPNHTIYVDCSDYN